MNKGQRLCCRGKDNAWCGYNLNTGQTGNRVLRGKNITNCVIDLCLIIRFKYSQYDGF